WSNVGCEPLPDAIDSQTGQAVTGNTFTTVDGFAKSEIGELSGYFRQHVWDLIGFPPYKRHTFNDDSDDPFTVTIQAGLRDAMQRKLRPGAALDYRALEVRLHFLGSGKPPGGDNPTTRDLTQTETEPVHVTWYISPTDGMWARLDPYKAHFRLELSMP